MMEGIVATSYSSGDKFYIDPRKLLPLARFLPQPKYVLFTFHCLELICPYIAEFVCSLTMCFFYFFYLPKKKRVLLGLCERKDDLGWNEFLVFAIILDMLL